MKKQLSLALLFVTALVVSSCDGGKFSDGESVWKFNEFMWVLVALPAIGALISLVKGLMASSSGDVRYDAQGRKIESNSRVPFHETNQFKYFVWFTIATIVIYGAIHYFYA